MPTEIDTTALAHRLGITREGSMHSVKLIDRILASITVDSVTGCWNWIGSIKKSGYGRISVRCVEVLAHRLVYEIANDTALLSSDFACHHCDNRRCVNPDHIFIGTAKDNAQDARSKKRYPAMNKTHCKHGREFTEENTLIKIAKSGEQRECMSCIMRRRAERMDRYRAIRRLI